MISGDVRNPMRMLLVGLLVTGVTSTQAAAKAPRLISVVSRLDDMGCSAMVC